MDDVERDRLVAWLIAEFEVQNGIDVTNDAMAITRLREVASRVGHVTDKYEVNLPYLAADATGPKHLHVVLTKRRIDDILAGREGPPHVDRKPRSVPPAPPEPLASERPNDASRAAWIFIAIVVVIGTVLSAFVYMEVSKQQDHDGHGQEHKR